MIKFIEKVIMFAGAVLRLETAHAMGYLKGALTTTAYYKEKEESKDHE